MKSNNFNEKVHEVLNKNSNKKDIEIETIDEVLNIKVGDLCRVKDLLGYKFEIMAAVDDEEPENNKHDDDLYTGKSVATMCLIDSITSPITVGSSTEDIVKKSLMNDPVEFFDLLHNLFHMAINYFAQIRENGIKDQDEDIEDDPVMNEIENLHNEFQMVFLSMFKKLEFEEYCKALINYKIEEVKECENKERQDELKLKLDTNKTLAFIKEITKFNKHINDIKKKSKKPTVIVIGKGTETTH